MNYKEKIYERGNDLNRNKKKFKQFLKLNNLPYLIKGIKWYVINISLYYNYQKNPKNGDDVPKNEKSSTQ